MLVPSTYGLFDDDDTPLVRIVGHAIDVCGTVHSIQFPTLYGIGLEAGPCPSLWRDSLGPEIITFYVKVKGNRSNKKNGNV